MLHPQYFIDTLGPSLQTLDKLFSFQISWDIPASPHVKPDLFALQASGGIHEKSFRK
jgi:hypothetical protein